MQKFLCLFLSATLSTATAFQGSSVLIRSPTKKLAQTKWQKTQQFSIENNNGRCSSNSLCKRLFLHQQRPGTRYSALSLLSFQQHADADFWTPLYLSSLAGASTCLGAAVVFLFPKQKDGRRQIPPELLCFSLALAGSVMLTVSIISIGPECLLVDRTTPTISSDLQAALVPLEQILKRSAFFGLGAALYYALSSNLLFPEPEEVALDLGGSNLTLSSVPSWPENTDNDGMAIAMDMTQDDATKVNTPQQRRAWRLTVLLFLTLLFHNFPEGLAVGVSAMKSDRLGLAVATGIALHNIPEGICISVPCLAARPDSPWLAFGLASISGLAEPVAALLPLLVLSNNNNNDASSMMDSSGSIMANVLALVAGIMVTVALNELLPEARYQLGMTGDEQGKPGPSGFRFRMPYHGGIATGALLMCATEVFLNGALM